MLFLNARYWPIIGALSDVIFSLNSSDYHYCVRLYEFAGGAWILVLIASEALLCIRVLALWHSHRRVRFFLATLYLAVLIIGVTCMGWTTGLDFHGVCTTAVNDYVSFSTMETDERLLLGSFSAIAVFELVATCMTLIHAFAISGRQSYGRLMASMYEGNLIYALTMFATSVANILIYGLPLSQGYDGILDVLQGVLHGLLASRIALSLRKAGDLTKSDTMPQSTELANRETVRFAARPNGTVTAGTHQGTTP